LSLQTYAIKLKTDHLLSSHNDFKREHYREEDLMLGMSTESLTTFVQELCQKETTEIVEMGKNPHHQDYIYACDTMNKWTNSFLGTYLGHSSL
jgi:hypothetical protein